MSFEGIDPLELLPAPGVLIDKLPEFTIDSKKKEILVDGIKVGLIKSLKQDGIVTIIEKYRVYVPTFKFENAWENILGSDVANDDEATEDYDKQRSHVFLDKRTRKPLLYTFAIDAENNLFFVSKRVDM